MITDAELTEKVQKDRCENSLGELIKLHSGIVYKIFNKYSQYFPMYKIDKDEFYQNKDTLIFKSALSYKKEKGKFVSWVGNQARYLCLNAIKANKDFFFEDNLENLPDLEERKEFTIDSPENLRENSLEILEKLDNLKDKRIKEIFKKRYFSSEKIKTWTIIGKEMKMCPSWVRELHGKGIKYLKYNL